MAEATRRFASLNNELSEILSVSEDKHGNRKIRYKNNILQKKPVSARKLQELKLAFSEFYLFLILLQNYQNLNFTGFRKILKKHDKVSASNSKTYKLMFTVLNKKLLYYLAFKYRYWCKMEGRTCRYSIISYT